MKNLKTSTAASLDIDLQSEGESLSLLCSAFDVECNRVFFASSANVIYGLRLSSSQDKLGNQVLPSGSTTASKARDMRRQRKKGGKFRAGSPVEEMALVDHRKGMALSAGAQRELKSLAVALLPLGKEGTARKVQQVADTFQQSQEATMKLTEDTIASTTTDENTTNFRALHGKIKRAAPFSSSFLAIKVLLPQ